MNSSSVMTVDHTQTELLPVYRRPKDDQSPKIGSKYGSDDDDSVNAEWISNLIENGVGMSPSPLSSSTSTKVAFRPNEQSTKTIFPNDSNANPENPNSADATLKVYAMAHGYGISVDEIDEKWMSDVIENELDISVSRTEGDSPRPLDNSPEDKTTATPPYSNVEDQSTASTQTSTQTTALDDQKEELIDFIPEELLLEKNQIKDISSIFKYIKQLGSGVCPVAPIYVVYYYLRLPVHCKFATVFTSGASCRVFKASCLQTRQIYAVKEMRRDDETNRGLFFRERKLLRKLAHPNIVHFCGIWITPEHYYIATKFASG